MTHYYLEIGALTSDPSAQSAELKTQLAGQIARALAVFCVDEIIVFDDVPKYQQKGEDGLSSKTPQNDHAKESYNGNTNPNYFLMHILSYLETPPHFRQWLFPMHPDLQKAGALPSLDMPHHLRPHEWCQYREGVTLEGSTEANGTTEERGKKKKRKDTVAHGESRTLVDAGFTNPVTVPSSIPPNTRVTLKFADMTVPEDMASPELAAEAVAPSAPREEAGYYWGYSVRSASSLSAVLTESPYDGGYDLSFGTSERGMPISGLTKTSSDQAPVPEFKHLLTVFGGVAGLEEAVQADAELEKMAVIEPSGLFDYWVNLCPGQGSRTVRTEEAVWLGLMGLRDIVVEKGIKKP